MSQQQRTVLHSRVALLIALSFCIYAALPRSTTSLRAVHEPDGQADPVMIFGLVAGMAIAGSIAARSPLPADRIVFGASALALMLSLASRLIPATNLLVATLAPLVWGVAAVASLVFLARASRQRTG